RGRVFVNQQLAARGGARFLSKSSNVKPAQIVNARAGQLFRLLEIRLNDIHEGGGFVQRRHAVMGIEDLLQQRRSAARMTAQKGQRRDGLALVFEKTVRPGAEDLPGQALRETPGTVSRLVVPTQKQSSVR